MIARFWQSGGRGTRRPHTRSLAALRLLALCPWVPIDVFACLGGGQPVSAYQLLERLCRAGLADVQRLNPGHVVGKRPVRVWSITEKGRAVLCHAAPATEDVTVDTRLPYGTCPRTRRRIRPADLPLLVAAYRLLAALVAEHLAAGRVVHVSAWEFRWRRCFPQPSTSHGLIVELPAAVVLARMDAEQDRRGHEALLLLPDLGTAPVIRRREAIRRLVTLASRHRAAGASAAPPVLVIATPNPDGHGTRAAAWETLLKRAADRQGEPPLPVRVLDWAQVASIAGQPRWCHDRGGHQSPRAIDQMLSLVGRHPFLTLLQLADLLGTTVGRAAGLRASLVERGWLRLVPTSEIPRTALEILDADVLVQGLAELTAAGRRTLAGWD